MKSKLQEKEVLLKTKELCKVFKNERVENVILKDLNISIYEGDFTVIMGSSGSGKSTLLNCISGMDKATSGKILYDGEDICGLNEKKLTHLRSKEFGFVFQQIHLVSNLTLFENVIVAGYLKEGRLASETDKRANELLDTMGLMEAKGRLPSQVSGGEQQRGAIVRALINQPCLLFADEPTGSLNKANTKDVLEIFTHHYEKGQSIIMVTHDIDVAIRANRIIYLSDGKVVDECLLEKYEESNVQARKERVTEWLRLMEW